MSSSSVVLFAAVLAFGDARSAAAGEALDADVVHLRAQARSFEHGENVERDVLRAIALFCRAARAGDAEAQYSLGWIYANGRGVERQDSVAALYFALAAEQGHPQAMNMLRFVGTPTQDVPDCLRPDPPPVESAAVVVQETPDAEPDLDDFVAATPRQKKALQLVNDLAPKYGVSPRLAIAVIRAESNFDPGARSSKNAQGLMQLIPETSARFNVREPFDAVENVRGGLAYLRWLLAYFEGDVRLVAAAYNAGERAVNRYKGLPPYPETRAYVNRILEFFGRHNHPYDSTVTAASPELSHIRRTEPIQSKQRVR
jgi:Transglycosylase SLT domain/Sel1 repeat